MSNLEEVIAKEEIQYLYNKSKQYNVMKSSENKINNKSDIESTLFNRSTEINTFLSPIFNNNSNAIICILYCKS